MPVALSCSLLRADQRDHPYFDLHRNKHKRANGSGRGDIALTKYRKLITQSDDLNSDWSSGNGGRSASVSLGVVASEAGRDAGGRYTPVPSISTVREGNAPRSCAKICHRWPTASTHGPLLSIPVGRTCLPPAMFQLVLDSWNGEPGLNEPMVS